MSHSHAGGHTCQQCGLSYRPARSTSRFCSGTCRLRHHRGTPKADIGTSTAVRSWLLKRRYAVPLDTGGAALTAPVPFILTELNDAVRRIRSRGLKSRLPEFSEEGLRAALKAARIAL